MDIDGILAAKKPVETQVPIWIEPAAGQRIAEIEHRITSLHAAGVFAGKALDDAQAELAKAKSDGAAHLVIFRFRAIGDDAYRQLLDAHPPSDEQRTTFRKLQLDRGIPRRELIELRYDEESFPPILVAASCVDPAMTVDQAKALWTSKRFNEAELHRLFVAAEAVNVRAPVGSLPED